MQNTDCCTNLPCVLRHSILSSQVFNIKSVLLSEGDQTCSQLLQMLALVLPLRYQAFQFLD